MDLSVLSGRPLEAIEADFSDLWLLYRAVRSKRPRVVLEFGSGCSTLVLAQALHDIDQREPGQHRRLYSIESQAYWADVTRSMLPAHLRAKCEVLDSPALAVEHEGTRCWRHAVLPGVVPDLIYLDGPPLSTDRKVAIDILDLEHRLPAGCLIIVDGRWRNARYLTSHLRRPLRVKRQILFDRTVVSILA